ncbi:MAG: S41 family peptidase [Acidobacteriota bacterium]
MRNRLGFLLFLTISTVAILGGLLGDRVSAVSSPSDRTQSLLKTFTETLALVQANYARDVASEKLVESSIRGMLRTLDPHSSFFATRDYNRLQEEQHGKYYGLGISIRAESPGSGRVVIVEPPAPGTPAYKAGLRVGDVIFQIEGKPIEDWDLNDEVIPNLKGPRGTKVNITVQRPGEVKPLDFVVERDEIPIYTIKFAFHIQPGVGYLRIDKFSETTGRELDKSLRELGEVQLSGLVLDLRDNPGGSLSAAIAVADHFLKRKQLIVSTRSRGGTPDRTYTAPHGRKYDYPMVVLINENSASASEIVAGALQDHDRALIVGETSFGKALVQTIYPLEGHRGLALTTGKYYTPSNRLIQRDYSGGFYDYFYNRKRAKHETRLKHETDGGRPVYDGGGITPDERVEPLPYTKLARQLNRKNLFFQFAARLTSGEIKSDVRYNYSHDEIAALDSSRKQDLVRKLLVSEKTLDIFRQYMKEKEVPFSDQSFAENRNFIRNRIKQELFLTLFGEREGYRASLEIDPQVLRALELLPKAQVQVQGGIAGQ